MAASVLNSDRAVEMSVYVIRAFVKYRSILAHHEEFSRRLAELEGRLSNHDKSLQTIVHSLRDLLEDRASSSPRPIGFRNADSSRKR